MNYRMFQTLAYEPDYSSAVNRLSSGVTTAPVYFIIGGMLPGEGAVITKDRLRANDIWTLNQTSEKSVKVHFRIR